MFDRPVKRFIVVFDKSTKKRLQFCVLSMDPRATLKCLLEFNKNFDGVIIPVKGYNIDVVFPGVYHSASEIRRAYDTEIGLLHV